MSLRESLDASLSGMDWLTDADCAAMDLARAYADAIEDGIARGGQDATKALYLGPHLLNTLTTLGGTPPGRKALELIAGEVADELEQIRARRASGA